MSHETDPLVIDIPDALRDLKCWFNWRWANQSDGGKFKLPVQPTGKPASSTGRETWYPYEKAAQAASKFEGLAIGLGNWVEPTPTAPRSIPNQFEWGVAGIDLDGAMVEGGGLKDWAAEILARVDSYAEYSPSGKGIHILVITDGAILPGIKLNLSETEHVEFYSTARYFTFTGNHVPGTPDDLKPREAVYNALRAEFEARRPSSARSRSVRRAEKPATASKASLQSVSLTDAELLDKAQSGPSGDAFKRLYSGDMKDYRNDHSSADMALAGRLAFWTGRDPEQIDRLFRESGLMRDKWDTRRGLSTYGEQTIEIAIDNCEDVYSGGDKSSESFVEKLKAKRAAKVAKTQVVGETVKAGHVREHERGDDKPDLKKRREAEKPTNPAIAQPSTDKALINGSATTSTKEPDTARAAKYTESGINRSKFDPVGASAPVVATPVHEGREHGGIPPAPSRVEAPTAIPSSYVDEDGVRRSGLTGRAIEEPRTLWPGTYDPKLPQADLFTGNGTFHDPVNVAKTVNVAQIVAENREALGIIEQHGDGAHENVHLEETVPLPVLADDTEELSMGAADPAMLADLIKLNDKKLTREPRLKPNRVNPETHHHQTDVGNGQRMTDRYSGMLIFSKTRGWCAFDKKRWAAGEEYAQRAAEETADSIAAEAQDPALDEKAAKAMFAWSLKSESSGEIGSMQARAQWQPEVFVKEEDLDSNPFLFNVQNGTLNIMTGKLQPHDSTDLITKIAACDYDPGAISDRWESFLEEATRGQDGLAEFLQRAAGYTLTGDVREDKIFVLHGVGGTGKSTFVGSLRAMMGDYGRTMRAETITEKGGGGHNEDVAVLAGARMVLAIETDESSHMREGLIKSLTGGDQITASRKNRPVFEFYPQLKLWLATNNMPKLRSDDSGTWRRVLKATFSHVPARPDPTLRDTLRAPLHQRAILAWAVRGAQAWWADAQNGVALRVPESVLAATEQMRRSMDGAAEFFATYITFGGGKTWTSVADIMRAYKGYCDETAVTDRFRLGPVAMNKAMQNQGAVPDRRYVAGRAERGFWGVTLDETPLR